jgi:hypothetical protein
MMTRRATVQAAVAGFFLAAITSSLCGAGGVDIALRGLVGAGVLWALAMLAGCVLDLVCGAAPRRADVGRDEAK